MGCGGSVVASKSGKLYDTDDPASLPFLKTPFKAGDPEIGEFTVNGKKVTVGKADTLKDILNNIDTATGGAVKGVYNFETDKIKLTSSAPIELGDKKDKCNFIKLAKLKSGKPELESKSTLGRKPGDNEVALDFCWVWIDYFDDIFGPAQPLLENLIDLKDNMEGSVSNFKFAVAGPKGEELSIKECITKLKTDCKDLKMTMTTDGGKPKLDCIGAAQEAKDRVDALLAIPDCLVAIIEGSVALAGQLEDLAKAIKEAMEKDPVEELKNAGVSPMDIPWYMKRIKRNSESVAQAPQILKDLVETTKSIAEEMKEAVSADPPA